MALKERTSDDVVVDESSNNSFLTRLVADGEDSACCKGSGESLEDTLSLTCDDSLTSTLSSPSTDSNMEEISDSEGDIYRSHDVLRRRLLPLAPSPIADTVDSSPIYRRPFGAKALWKMPFSGRIFWVTFSIALYLVAMSGHFRSSIDYMEDGTREIPKWERFFRRRFQKIPSRSKSQDFTIRIKGNRLDLMLQSLDFHAQCPSVRNVQVEWTDENTRLPKSVLDHKSGKVRPLEKPTTPAVFLLDEDIILSCDEIERAFHEWRLDPSRLVGFFPFHHSNLLENSQALRSNHGFQLKRITPGRGDYSMLSDQAVFVHNLYLRSLPSVPAQCQPLGLSIIVSYITSKPPVAVMSKPQAIRLPKLGKIVSPESSRGCQRWIRSIGVKQLPDQVATIVGQQRKH